LYYCGRSNNNEQQCISKQRFGQKFFNWTFEYIILHLFFNRQRFRAEGILIPNLHKALLLAVIFHDTKMKLKIILLLLISPIFCLSQDTIKISKVDTLLPFFGKSPLRLMGYENRVVPFNSHKPLYVLITYKDSKNKRLEYFKVDSAKYLVYEFFRNDKGSSNEGLKSSGLVKIIDKINDTSTTGVRHIGGKEKYTREIHYYKGFSKEGEWTEYEDSLFSHRYWTGTYLNNRKVNIWSNYIYDPNDDRLIQQIDYDKDSTKKIFSVNIIGQLSVDSIGYYLLGRWPMGYDPSDDKRNLLMKCQLYDGHYGDDCNSRFGKISFYEFFTKGKFIGQNGETTKKKTYQTSGLWKLIKLSGKVILEISSSDKRKIRYDIIYLDREGNMVADRQ
jgi:hypothetical protein